MKRFIIVFSSIIILFWSGIYFFQDNLIFQSTGLDKNHAFSFDLAFEEHFITTPDGEQINALWFKSGGDSKGLVFYFHGNAQNLQRWGSNAADLTRLGYDVVMMDYRGYGKSSGTPTEENLYRDAHQVYQWAKSKSNYSRTVIYGRSLGTAVATQLSVTVQPDLLILETPFDELKGALPSWVKPFAILVPLRYQFPTKDYLMKVSARKIIFHGTDDRIVPLSSALNLKPLLKEGDEFIIIPNGTHRNLRTFEVYQLKLSEVLK